MLTATITNAINLLIIWYSKILRHFLILIYQRLIAYSVVFATTDDKDKVKHDSTATLNKIHLDMISSRKWKELLAWIVFYPNELLYVDKRNQTVLHYACLFRAPAQIVQMLLYSQPELACIRNVDNEIPLHWAIRLSAPNEIIKLLLSAHPSSACCMKDINCNTGLSMVWERNESLFIDMYRQSGKQNIVDDNRWKSIMYFLQGYSYYSETITYTDNLYIDEDNSFQPDCIDTHCKRFLPLHTATQCSCCPISLYTLLIRVFDDHICKKDNVGRVPLLIACSNPISNRSIGLLTKVHILLSECPESAQEMDRFGRLPIFAALEAHLTLGEGIERLIFLHPMSILLYDPMTQLPMFLLAAVKAGDNIHSAAKRQHIPHENHLIIESQHDKWDRSQLSTIFSLLRKDPAQLAISSTTREEERGEI